MKLSAASGLFLFLFLQDSCRPQTGYNLDGDAWFFRLLMPMCLVELKGSTDKMPEHYPPQ